MHMPVTMKRRIAVWMATLAGAALLVPMQASPVAALATTTVRGWPGYVSPLVVNARDYGGVTIRTGTALVQRSYRLQRAKVIAGEPLSWATYKNATSSRQGSAEWFVVAPSAGTWRFRLQVLRTATAGAATTAVLSVTVKEARDMLSPRDLTFSADGSKLSYLTGSVRRPELRVLDVATRVESRYRTAIGGVVPNGPSGRPWLSPDGTWLAFWSDATNLVAGEDANNASDLFLKNLTTGTVKRIDTGPWGTQTGGMGSDLNPKVAFSADSTRLAFQASRYYAYVHTMATGETVEVVSTSCTLGDPTFSEDGTSLLISLTQWGGAPDVYTHGAFVDIATHEVTLQTLKSDGTARFIKSDAGVWGYVSDTERLLIHVMDESWNVSWWLKDTTTGAFIKPPQIVDGWHSIFSPDRRMHAGIDGSGRLVVVDFLNLTSRVWGPSTVAELEPLAVSNNGRHIAFARYFSALTPSLRLLNLNTGAARNITGASMPAYSPSGPVAYVRDDKVVLTTTP